MIINGINVQLKEVDEPTCDGCVFDNGSNCDNCILNEPQCSVYTIYVKSNE